MTETRLSIPAGFIYRLVLVRRRQETLEIAHILFGLGSPIGIGIRFDEFLEAVNGFRVLSICFLGNGSIEERLARPWRQLKGLVEACSSFTVLAQLELSYSYVILYCGAARSPLLNIIQYS